MGATISPESAPKPSTVGSLDKSITPIRSEIPPYSLFARSGLSRANPLNLIRGFENEPLVSLEEALAPLFGKTDYLRNYIKEAKVYSHHPSEHGLTSDESAAIYIYTMKWGNACLYNRLQMAWESGDPLKMKVWLRYLKLFKTAYNKLPEVDEEIWQGKSFDPRLKNDLESETAPLYLTMELLSSSKTFVEQSLSNGGVQGKILIGFERVGAKWAGDYAADSRNGAIVFPGPQVTVSKIEPSDDGNSVTYHVIGPAPIEDSITEEEEISFDLILIEVPMKKQLSLEKHYFCPNAYCKHQCRRKHKPNHCHGFDVISHRCDHNCGFQHGDYSKFSSTRSSSFF